MSAEFHRAVANLTDEEKAELFDRILKPLNQAKLVVHFSRVNNYGSACMFTDSLDSLVTGIEDLLCISDLT